MDILISGAGITGPVVAYWLLRGNPLHRITIVERDPVLRLTGQSVDIRQAAVDVIRRMRLEALIRESCTEQAGLNFVDDVGNLIASFPATGDPEAQGLTSEFEIFRGDLARIFMDAVKDRTRLVLGEYVAELDQRADKVFVRYTNGRAAESFDLVIAADGQHSRIRSMILGTTDKPRIHLNSLNVFAAYFTATQDFLRGSKFASACSMDRGRAVFVGPDSSSDRCRVAFLKSTGANNEEEANRWRAAFASGSDAVKSKVADEFRAAGFMTSEVLNELLERGEDFHWSEILQVKAPKLAVGRVVLVGDAAASPSALTGMGTSLGIIGAYLLAGQLTESSNVEAALLSYEEILLPFARKVQQLPPGSPSLIYPQSRWGVRVLRGVQWFVYWSRVSSLLSLFFKIPAFSKNEWKLPDYHWSSEDV